jgi:hypothetical protein
MEFVPVVEIIQVHRVFWSRSVVRDAAQRTNRTGSLRGQKTREVIYTRLVKPVELCATLEP